MTGLTREHSLAGKLKKALPAWLEVNRLRQELQELSVPEGFPADGKERFEKLQEEIDRLGNELAEQTDAITDIERELEKIAVDPRVADRKADIEHVQQMIQSVKDARRDLPAREGERESTLREIEDELAELVPGWTIAELGGFRVARRSRPS